MADGVKIVMVGGGSYAWSPRLLSDLMQAPALAGAEVVLLDPNQVAAGEIAAAGRAMATARQNAFTITTTTDEAVAFRDAQFVIVTISTGDLPAMKLDLAIPERYGIFQTVGDTVGPGGWSRSLRNVPVFVHLAQQIEKYAPRAVVLNYTNPMACLTGVFQEVGNLRVIGLCHGVFETYRVLEKLFGVEERDLAVRFAGVNHFFWVLDFAVRGRPGYPLLAEKLGGRAIHEVMAEGQHDAVGWHSRHVLMSELYREYGYLPYAADRHTCEFLPGLITPTPEALERFRLVRTSIEQRYNNREAARVRAKQYASGTLAPPERTRETAVDIIAAFVTGQPFMDVANLPNVGQVDNLPRRAVVETLGQCDALGFRALTSGSLPEPLRALVEPHCHVQLLTLQAALTGNRRLALESLRMDPVCAHLPARQVREMGEELLAATRQWLPQFA